MDNDLPPGYRWATEDEMDRPDAIVVKRTADNAGVPYTQDEADIAVPIVRRIIVGERCPIELFGRDTEQDKRDALASSPNDHEALVFMYQLGYDMSSARVIRS